MVWVSSLISGRAYINFPQQFINWVGFALLIGLVIWRVVSLPEKWPSRRSLFWPLWVGLFILTPITTLFLGIGIGATTSVSQQNSAIAMLFMAVPWMLGVGLLGELPAILLSMVSGVLFALWGSHSIFTPLEFALLTIVFSVLNRQSYRTRIFAFLRNPIGAVMFVGILYCPVKSISAFFSTSGGMSSRLDFALTQQWMTILAMGISLLCAGLVTVLVRKLLPDLWEKRMNLLPSPLEKSLRTRFNYYAIPFIVVLFFVLTISDWYVAGAAAEKMLGQRLASTAEVAGESLPYFLEAGQSLLLSSADSNLLQVPVPQLSAALNVRIHSAPFFQQFILLDVNAKVLAKYPDEMDALTQQELDGAGLALNGFSPQAYILPPKNGDDSTRLSYITGIKDAGGKVQGVLVGRADMRTNPFTQPAIRALNTLADIQGRGLILDEQKRILFDTTSGTIMTSYNGATLHSAGVFQQTSPDGSAQLGYYYPIPGRPWSIVLTIPASQAQSLALSIAGQLLVILLVLMLLAFVGLQIAINTISNNLTSLSYQTSNLAKGDLKTPIQVRGVDEVGQLGEAFEQMRVSLKARMQDLSSLLTVSQGVAANLEINKAVAPILQAALLEGANGVRMTLVSDVVMQKDQQEMVTFEVGKCNDLYAHLDPIIFEVVKQQHVLPISNLARSKWVNLPAGIPRPGALLAVAIQYENTYYGALWVSFQEPHNFSESDTRFLILLAGQAALAAANARLYAAAEIGRQRLEAVIASAPEPVLVIDEHGFVLLLNSAALQASGLISSAEPGQKVEEVVTSQELLDLINAPMDENIQSREIFLPNGKIFSASVSRVMAKNIYVGKICILRDITHYKELDALKTEFVSTVSHDLRSPLTLVKGYASMLKMVGGLNEQQVSYAEKIGAGIDNMNRLVTNLLDLGRIDAGMALSVEAVDPMEIVKKVVEDLTPQAIQKRIQLADEQTGNMPESIEVDKALIQQALQNLVENAIKYTNIGGEVKILVEAHPETVVFAVHDTGIGVAPLDLPRVFEKFYRSGRREAYQNRGSGLGLSIVKSVAERHGGKVWVESQLGKGSTFSMEIPIHAPVETRETNLGEK